MTLQTILGEDGFVRLSAKAADNCDALGKSLRNCPTPSVRKYAFRTDCAKSDLKVIEAPPGCSIYVFELADPNVIDVVREGYALAAGEKSRSVARDNRVSSSCLYVGSTTGSSLQSRIGQHFGFGYAGTYALHLSHWQGTPFEVRLTVATYEGVEPRVIQELEDYLWSTVQPMFGKTGRS